MIGKVFLSLNLNIYLVFYLLWFLKKDSLFDLSRDKMLIIIHSFDKIIILKKRISKKKTFKHACQEINDQYDMDMRFEEIKEGRKVVAVKFLFKKTLVHKVTNRKTGIEKNVYVKPKARIKKKKESIPEVLEGQLSFDDLKDDPTSIKSVMSSLLTKFFPPKK